MLQEIGSLILEKFYGFGIILLRILICIFSFLVQLLTLNYVKLKENKKQNH
jgi:hypothetical protein